MPRDVMPLWQDAALARQMNVPAGESWSQPPFDLEIQDIPQSADYDPDIAQWTMLSLGEEGKPPDVLDLAGALIGRGREGPHGMIRMEMPESWDPEYGDAAGLYWPSQHKIELKGIQQPGGSGMAITEHEVKARHELLHSLMEEMSESGQLSNILIPEMQELFERVDPDMAASGKEWTLQDLNDLLQWQKYYQPNVEGPLGSGIPTQEEQKNWSLYERELPHLSNWPMSYEHYLQQQQSLKYPGAYGWMAQENITGRPVLEGDLSGTPSFIGIEGASSDSYIRNLYELGIPDIALDRLSDYLMNNMWSDGMDYESARNWYYSQMREDPSLIPQRAAPHGVHSQTGFGITGWEPLPGQLDVGK